MQRIQDTLGKLIALILIPILLGGCAPQTKKPPLAVKGVLDLRDWDFEKDGNINLDGEWEFYWKTFPEGESLELPEDRKDFIQVPKPWNGHILKIRNNSNELNNQALEGKGYSTYRLKILKGSNENISIRIRDQHSNLKLIANKKVVYQSGILGNSNISSKSSRNYPKYLNILYESLNPELELLVSISNYEHARGGFVLSLQIGNNDNINNLQSINLGLDLFISGILIIMGFYHFSLFYLRREDRSTLYFGIFCILIFIRTLSTGEWYIHFLFPNLSFSWSLTIEYLTMYLGLPSFLLFLYSLYPKEINHFFLGLTILMSSILSILVLFSYSYYFTKSLVAMQLMILVNLFYGIYYILLAIKRKREGAKILLTGFVVFTIVIINDLLYSQYIIFTGQLLPAGLVFFIFSQSYLLSARFSKAFSDAKEARRIAEERRILVEEAKEEIERLNKAKDEFLSNLSHEIKTPLVTIYGYSEMIAMDEEIPEATKEYGKEIYTSAGKLNSYMDDVLLVTDLETNLQVDKQSIDLSSLIEGSLSQLESFREEKQIQIEKTNLGSIVIEGDAVLLGRAIANVLKNALVYNKVGGKVSISVKERVAKKCITISDTGIGIPPEYREKIFEKFFRVDSSLSYEVSGVGLGLFLAKKIIELHGGNIEVDSRVGEGSELRITV